MYACVWASSDELFVLGTDLAKGFPTNPYFNFVDLESKELKPLRRDLDLYFGNSLNSDVRGLSGESLRVKKGKLYSIITSGPDSTIVSLDKSGEVEDVMLSDGSIGASTSIQGSYLYEDDAGTISRAILQQGDRQKN